MESKRPSEQQSPSVKQGNGTVHPRNKYIVLIIIGIILLSALIAGVTYRLGYSLGIQNSKQAQSHFPTPSDPAFTPIPTTYNTPIIPPTVTLPLTTLAPAPTSISSKYATILRLTDSKGNTQLLSEYNNQNTTWPITYPILKVGDTVTITVDVKNDVSDPVQYEFVGTGFPNRWQSENKVTITITDETFNIDTIHLRVFIKNSDSQFRAPDYDDMVQIFYQKSS